MSPKEARLRFSLLHGGGGLTAGLHLPVILRQSNPKIRDQWGRTISTTTTSAQKPGNCLKYCRKVAPKRIVKKVYPPSPISWIFAGIIQLPP